MFHLSDDNLTLCVIRLPGNATYEIRLRWLTHRLVRGMPSLMHFKQLNRKTFLHCWNMFHNGLEKKRAVSSERVTKKRKIHHMIEIFILQHGETLQRWWTWSLLELLKTKDFWNFHRIYVSLICYEHNETGAWRGCFGVTQRWQQMGKMLFTYFLNLLSAWQ